MNEAPLEEHRRGLPSFKIVQDRRKHLEGRGKRSIKRNYFILDKQKRVKTSGFLQKPSRRLKRAVGLAGVVPSSP